MVICLFLISFLYITSFNESGLTQEIVDKPDCSKLDEYIKTEPPPESETTEVGVGVFFINLLDVNNTKETFTIDGIFIQNWKDPRLSKNSLGFSANKCDLDISDIWSPEPQALNLYEAKLIKGASLEINKDGDVVYRQRYIGELYNQFDLKNFPFDKQAFTIELATLEQDESIKLFYNEENTEFSDTFNRQDWEIGDLNVLTYSDYLISQDRYLSKIAFSFIAKRNRGYYIWNIFLPVSLIVLMAWCVFWIDPAQLGPQIGLSTAAVFTLVAYRFTINALLPKVSYLTLMDKFLLSSTILVFIALGEAILTGHLSREGNEKLALKIDKWFRVLYLLLFVLIFLIIFKLL